MRRLLVVAAVTLAGCASVIGLSDFEIVDPTDAGVDGAAPDTSAPVRDAGAGAGDGDVTVLPPVTCAADGGCAAIDLDGGFRPVGVATGTSACPGGFGAAILAQAGPATTTGSCGCAIATTTPPPCNLNKATVTYLDGNSSNACTINGPQFNYTPNNCIQQERDYVHPFVTFAPPATTGGSCTATPDATHVQATLQAITMCPPEGACSDALCQGQKLGLLRACVVSDVDTPCPSGPFSDRIVLGDSTSVSCPACSCTATQQSCGGQLQHYPDPDCALPAVLTLDAGACTSTNTGEHTLSVRYIPGPTAQYVADGGGAPTVTITHPRTLCCVP